MQFLERIREEEWNEQENAPAHKKTLQKHIL